MGKINCWESMQCGKGPCKNGLVSDESENTALCPAATEVRLDGINNGKNAGRACWATVGTLCEGKTKGVFAEKYGNDTPGCMNCKFYKLVHSEENGILVPTSQILLSLRYNPTQERQQLEIEFDEEHNIY